MNNQDNNPSNDNDNNSHDYVVQNGDTLQSIAVRFDVTVSWLLQINHMFSDFILPGDVIKVWKRDIEKGYTKDIPARLVDPNNIEGHSPHGHLFLYPDRIVFNAEIRDESITILFEGIKDIDIIIHPFNEVTAIPATPVKVKNQQNADEPMSLPSAYPPASKAVDIQSPLSLKEIKPEELLYLMMINYDESKIIQSGTEVHVPDLNENADNSSDNTRYNCVFFSSMRKYVEPFKHDLVTAVNKMRIKTIKKKNSNIDINNNNNDNNNNNNNDNNNDNNSNDNNNNNDNDKTQPFSQINNSEDIENNNDLLSNEQIALLEDADTWVPDYYKSQNNKSKKNKDSDTDSEHKHKNKKKKNGKSDNEINEQEQTASSPTFDPNFKKRYSNPRPLFPIDLIDGPSLIISSDEVTQFRYSLPYRYRNGCWHLLYQLSRDGSSYFTFYRRTEKKLPLIFLILTNKEEKIGSFLSKGIHISSRYYGSGESYVFHFTPSFECFRWSKENDFFISSPENEINIGGGGASAIWIDSKMSSAYSGECQTFSSPSLTSEPNFKVLNIEVWCIDNIPSLSSNSITKPLQASINSSASSFSSNSSTSPSISKIAYAESTSNLE